MIALVGGVGLWPRHPDLLIEIVGLSLTMTFLFLIIYKNKEKISNFKISVNDQILVAWS